MADSIDIYSDASDLLTEFKERSKYMDRTTDMGIVNDQTGSSFSIRENGDAVVASGTTSQYKLNHDNGAATEISMQSNKITNRVNIMTEEFVINNHKMNPQLYNLSDMKELFGDTTKAIGDLTMMGTVLVKAWEPNLGRYVLIRRQVRIPLFSTKLNVADAPDFYGLDTDVTKEVSQVESSDTSSSTTTSSSSS